MTASSKRESILRAVEALILRGGIHAITLELVAREAGVSKGGLLYHFKNKDEMVAGLVGRLIQRFEDDMQRFRKAAREGKGSMLRAFLAATQRECRNAEEGDNSGGREFYAAILAILATSPKLARPLQERYAKWQQEIESDGLDPALATVLRLAVDGLWLSQMFGLGVLSAERRRDVIAAIERLSADAWAPQTI